MDNNFKSEAKEMLDRLPIDTIAEYMDDDIREDLHMKLAPCSDMEFLTAYLARHYEKFEEQFTI